jgi:hypothetical protein
MPKLVLTRGSITNTDELVIVLSEPDNEYAQCLSSGLQRPLWLPRRDHS